MKNKDVLEVLQEMAPLSLALSYDNPGFLVGDAEAEVTSILVALDCTPAVVEQAKKIGAELIVTHHPVIFDPLKAVTAGENNVIYACLSAGIAVISAHTNLDSADGGVNDCLAAALGLSEITVIEDDEGFRFRKGVLSKPLSADALAAQIKAALGGVVRYTDGGKPIKTVAVCGGSGGELLELARAEADAYVTADVKHKTFIRASTCGFSMFDAGHFHTEDTVIRPLSERLADRLPGVRVQAVHLTEIKTV